MVGAGKQVRLGGFDHHSTSCSNAQATVQCSLEDNSIIYLSTIWAQLCRLIGSVVAVHLLAACRLLFCIKKCVCFFLAQYVTFSLLVRRSHIELNWVSHSDSISSFDGWIALVLQRCVDFHLIQLQCNVIYTNQSMVIVLGAELLSFCIAIQCH